MGTDSKPSFAAEDQQRFHLYDNEAAFDWICGLV